MCVYIYIQYIWLKIVSADHLLCHMASKIMQGQLHDSGQSDPSDGLPNISTICFNIDETRC